MTKEMVINTVEGQECRIAIVEDGHLEELYIERASSASHVGNIYKGRVTNVEPAIQAAFVDFGGTKNGFLHVSDVHPQHFPKGRRHSEAVGKKRPHRERPPVQECLRRGQEVVVQMTKEGIGTKGPTLTTYLSIPGRLLVMMPGMSRLGVSRKIEDEEARAKARQILADLTLPQDVGFIIRTAGMDQSKRELQRDLHYLTRLWKSVSQRIKTARAPAEIYQESDLVIRTLRDVYNTDIERIICDNESVARTVKEFLDVAMPRGKYTVELYVGKTGLFHDFHLENEIERIYARRVELKSGGSLVIDQTEALVAIDVNSGRFREHNDAETTALKMNLEAAGEIARQLRLRDMGGVIIIDFIDMREERNRRAVERAFREYAKKDRARSKVLRISAFGIVEMTRQRVRPSLKDSIYRRCAYCGGSGLIKSQESQALLVMRSLQRATSHGEVANIEVVVTPPVAHHLANYQRREISQLEQQTRKTIIIRADSGLTGDEIRINCTNNRGSAVAWDEKALVGAGKDRPPTIDVAQLGGQPPQAEALPLPQEEQEPQEAPAIPAQVAPEPGQPEPPVHAHVKPAATRPAPPVQSKPPAAPTQQQPQQPSGKKKRRRGHRGGRKHRRRGEGGAPAGQVQQPAQAGRPPASALGEPQAQRSAEPPPRPVAEAPQVPPPHSGEQAEVSIGPVVPQGFSAETPAQTASLSVPPHAPTGQRTTRRPTRRRGRGQRKQVVRSEAADDAKARTEGVETSGEFAEDDELTGMPFFKPGD